MEAQTKQEIQFQKVHLCCADSSYFGIVSIAIKPAYKRESNERKNGDSSPVKNHVGLRTEKSREVNLSKNRVSETKKQRAENS